MCKSRYPVSSCNGTLNFWFEAAHDLVSFTNVSNFRFQGDEGENEENPPCPPEKPCGSGAPAAETKGSKPPFPLSRKSKTSHEYTFM